MKAGATVSGGVLFAGLALLGALLLAGCTAAQVTQGEAAAAKFCAYDAQLQPIAGAVVAAVPGAAPVVTVDNAVIHPAVLAVCGALPK